MSAAVATSRMGTEASGLALTFVAGSCSLSCGGCPIDAMKEIAREDTSPGFDPARLIPKPLDLESKKVELSPDCFVRFADDIGERYEIGKLLMQGFEPLHPHTLPYTITLMRYGANEGIPEIGFITNGQQWYDDYIAECAEMGVSITISLNSDHDSMHDSTRGSIPIPTQHKLEEPGILQVEGPFLRTNAFIKNTVNTYLKYHSPERVKDLLTISSVLFSPKTANDLLEFPEFIQFEYGLTNIVFNLFKLQHILQMEL